MPPKVSAERRAITKKFEAFISPAQKRWNRIFAATGDSRLANFKVYGDEDIDKYRIKSPGNLLKKPDMRAILMRVMEDQGITIPFLVEKHKKILEKSKRMSDLNKGVELGYKAYQVFDDPEDRAKKIDVQVGIDLFIKQREARGLEVPAEVVETKEKIEHKLSLGQSKLNPL